MTDDEADEILRQVMPLGDLAPPEHEERMLAGFLAGTIMLMNGEIIPPAQALRVVRAHLARGHASNDNGRALRPLEILR